MRTDLKNIYICSLHFDENAFNRTLDVIRLKDDAVPSLFIQVRIILHDYSLTLGNKMKALYLHKNKNKLQILPIKVSAYYVDPQRGGPQGINRSYVFYMNYRTFHSGFWLRAMRPAPPDSVRKKDEQLHATTFGSTLYSKSAVPVTNVLSKHFALRCGLFYRSMLARVYSFFAIPDDLI